MSKRKDKDKAVKTPKQPPTQSPRDQVLGASNLAQLKAVLVEVLGLK